VLSRAIGDLLPSAVGVALSPIPIIAVILILATPRARSNGPALYFVFAPEAAARPLDAIRRFMEQHNAIIMFVVLLVLGAKLLGDGLGGVGS
jgi:hypothetical protein